MKEPFTGNLENLQFEYEFPDTQGFDCNPDKMPCGLCCHKAFQLTFKEINQINRFLEKWLFTSEFNDFVLDKVTHLQTPIKFDPRSLDAIYEKYRKELQAFFKPANFTAKDSTLFVLSYRLSYHTRTHECIFFNPITYKCAIRDVRPTECQIYPFNFEYDFELNNKIKVFIIQECEALKKLQLVDKSSLEATIRNYLATIFAENDKLQNLNEKIGIPLSGQRKISEKRKIRQFMENLEEMTKWVDSIHISKDNTEKSMIRDMFLEEKTVTCLNEEAYTAYLLQILRKEPPTSDWE
jgi:Fe-S-cluster containining protein